MGKRCSTCLDKGQKAFHWLIESTIKKCLIKAAERLHGGSKAVDRVKKVPLSDTTMVSYSVELMFSLEYTYCKI